MSTAAQPATIRDLHRCEGCGRWVINIWAHVGCGPSLLAPPRLAAFDVPRESIKRYPRRKILGAQRQGSSWLLSLECGHQQSRHDSHGRVPASFAHCKDCHLGGSSA